MFEIVFMGTSASAPSVQRGLPAAVVLAGEQRFLVDCGEGTQRQILRSGIGFKRLNQILLTHAHLDHILGLGGLVSTFARWEESIDTINIYGGKSTLDRVQALLFGVVLQFEKLPTEVRLIDLKPGPFIRGKNFTVSAFPVIHRGSGNFAFMFKEDDRRPFLNDRAQALGVPEGPERSQLVKGQSVTLPDGRVVSPDDVLGEQMHGAKLVYIGDLARFDHVREHVQDADTLVRAFGHITAREAAELARDCNVKSLLLTHISRRYRARDLVEEARAIFPNTVVARDLEHYTIKRGIGAERKIEETPVNESE
jgi:ribonuclease Z